MEFAEVKMIAERALEDGKLTKQEIDEIAAAIAADNMISDEESALLDDLRQKVQRGEIQVIDSD
jgi:hypothetical protein